MAQTFTKIINILGNSSEYSIGDENDESRSKSLCENF